MLFGRFVFAILFPFLLRELVADDSSEEVFNQTSVPLCRDRMDFLPVESFRLKTCSSCYFYLFLDDQTKQFYSDEEWLVGPNETHVKADIRSEMSRSLVCATLTPNECDRWTSCCLDAEECCNHQLEWSPSVRPPPTTSAGKPFCPQTWDGYGCWDYTAPGKVAVGACPEFIKFAVQTEKSYKECLANGTWYLHPESSLEWTDYSSCINVENLKRSTVTSIICNVISLIALVPSVIIFVCYRPLRTQKRVLLHINLFSSFVLYAIATLLWDILIVLDRIENPSKSSYIYQNTNGCKLVYILMRYSRMANFLWMFCEAVYLHRLLVKAFEPPKNLIVFYVAGWVFPWIPIITYAVLRFLYANTSCWIKPFGYWEWLIYVPNLLALLMNLIVLLDIIRMLVTQVQSLENEPSSYRRALKATFILVPLFGLQLFLVIYRPPFQSSFGRQYEMIAAFVVNLQGLFVALIFCLVNGEVMAQLKRSWQRLRHKVSRRDYSRAFSVSATTHSELFTSSTREARCNSVSKTAVVYTRRPYPKTALANGEHANHDLICQNGDDVKLRQNGDDVKLQSDYVILPIQPLLAEEDGGQRS